MQTSKRIKPSRLSAIANNAEKCAAIASLVYVSDTAPGIERRRSGKGFIYYYQNRKLTSQEDLLRIKKLVIPPAWKKVWICKMHNGHIQCTGYDALNRKQYKYHHDWIHVRNQTKYSRLLEFGKALPAIRARVEKDLTIKELTVQKVIAAAIAVMEKTFIRIGSSAYEKLYGSFGLTTLKDNHVKINGHHVEFAFKGKKGIVHNVSLKSKKLANVVKQCRDIPGKELFQYVDESGNYHSIDSGMVNEYIKNASGSDFTAKDFRTWAGTLHALDALKNLEEAGSLTQVKKNLVEAMDYVSKKLGNTRAVCKKYYVHPVIIDLYEKKMLSNYLQKLNEKEGSDSGLSNAELVLMEILSSKYS